MKKIVVLLSLSLVLLSPAFAQKKTSSKKIADSKEISRQDPKEVERMNNFKKEAEKTMAEIRVDYEKQMQRKFEIFNKELHLDGREMDEFWKQYVEYSNRVFDVDNEYKRFKDNVYREQFGENRREYDELKIDGRNAEKLLRLSIDTEFKKNEMKRQFIESLLKNYKPEVVLKYTVLEERMEKRPMRADIRQDQPALRDMGSDKPAIRKK